MKITIKCANLGKEEVFDLENAAMTVGELKAVIAERCPTIPAEQQRLIFAGRILKDFQTLEQCAIVDGCTIHMVKGAARKTEPAPSTATPAAPSTTAAPTMGSAGAMPSMGGFPAMGGFPGMGADASMQALLQNPQMMQEMLNSPMMDALFSNPELMRSMIMSNPQTQQLIERNPQIAQMLSDPEVMRQALQAARNPEAMRQMMRSADLMMNQLDAMPGGFDALQRAYTEVGEPLMNAMSSSSSEPQEVPAPEQYPPPPPSDGPSDGALPNPWGSSGSASTGAGAGAGSAPASGAANPFGITPEMMNSLLAGAGAGAQGFGAGAGAGAGGMPFGMSPDTVLQMMDNPMVQQQLSAFAQNPELVRALANSPLLAGMPGSEIFRQNPQLLANMLQPNTMRQMMELQRSLNNPQASGSTGAFPSSSAGAPQPSLFETTHIATTPAPSSAPAVNYAERYADQLAQLEEMGFTDRDRNIQALIHAQGNVQFAVARLLG